MTARPVKVHDLLSGRADAPGVRVLVDRLWPRGVAKMDLAYDLWLGGAAPSAELRRWFGHAPRRFEEFRRSYEEELNAGNDDVTRLRRLAHEGDVALLFAARDRRYNHAVVLAQWLASRGGHTVK
ncbi:DUF488 domain-containing protein [Corynebacterium mastitidis]|uniref:DUF488 domain-containing protein n=1 Tax=Corynebacterium mastitidis TaxID=161890 RepID=UPI0025516F45|nr:DUF488 family protein [Corynebacterium mastitidis]MDK8451505.1 DUF488 family protein [Corynebacterium mastitidis]